MRIKIKFISIILFLCIFVNSSTVSFCMISKFIDVNKNDDYYVFLNYCVDNGYINGMTKNTFEPDKPITRAMIVKILGCMTGITKENRHTGSLNILDVSENDWAYEYIQWALNNGITTGTESNNGSVTFSPDSYLTWEQLNIFVSRYISKYTKAVEYLNYFTALSSSLDLYTKNSAEFVKRKDILKIIVRIDSIITKNNHKQIVPDIVKINLIDEEQIKEIEYDDAVFMLTAYIGQYIPYEIVKKFNENDWKINILSNKEFNIKYGKKYSGMTDFENKQLYIRITDNIPDVICHEFGHFLQDIYGYDSIDIDNIYSLYADKIVSIKRLAYLKNEISYKNKNFNYAKTNKCECFAEGFMLYCLTPEEFQKECPEYFEFINSIIRN